MGWLNFTCRWVPPAGLEDARLGGGVDGAERVVGVADRGRGVEVELPSQDRSRLDEVARGGVARLESADDAGGEGAGRGQLRVPLPPGVPRGLFDDHPQVQGVAFGVLVELFRGARRQQATDHPVGELRHFTGVQGPDLEHATAGTQRDPPQTFRHRRSLQVARGHDHKHAIGHQPSEREQQRVQGVAVGPMGVVDQGDDHALVLQVTPQLQQAGADGDRVLRRGRAGSSLGARDPDQLVQQSVGEDGHPRPDDARLVSGRPACPRGCPRPR